MDRRTLLGHLLSIGATSLVAAMGGAAMATLASSPASAAEVSLGSSGGSKRKFRYGMVIDTRRCVGCKACMVACKAENKTPPGVSYNKVVEDALGLRDHGSPLFVTQPCMHCENPPCVAACPANATFKRERDGIVVVDYDRCAGFGDCVNACPYGARSYDRGRNYPAITEETPWAQVPSPELGQFRRREAGKPPIETVRKCTFCLHLQDEEGRYDKAAGRWPSCAKTCTGKAIHFGDFMDRESEVSVLLRERQSIRLKEERGTNPNVYYLL
jgi:molybdopterin-containing oxidoreductase family iron-sulfur binding subunit